MKVSKIVCKEIYNEEETKDLLKSVIQSDLWITVPISKIGFILNKATEENPSCISIKIKNRIYPLTDNALNDLSERYGVNCKVFSISETENKYKLLKIGKKLLSEKSNQQVVALYREDAIRAVHSSDYVQLNQLDLIDSFEKDMEARFPEKAFHSAIYSSDETSITYKFNDDTLLEEYNKKLIGAGFAPIEKGISVKLITSDTAFSSASIYMFIDDYNGLIGQPLKLAHRGNANIKEWKATVSKAFSLTRENINNITALLDIHINHPEACLKNVCDKLKIPKKTFAAALGWYQHDVECDPDSITAHHIYSVVCKAVRELKGRSDYLTKAELIAQLLSPGYDWEEVDVAI